MTHSELDQELNEMAERELRRDQPPPPSAPSFEQAGVSSSAAAGRVQFTRALAPIGRDAADDRNLAVMTHIATIAAAVFSGGFLDILVSAAAYVAFRDRGELLKSHVKAQLNFQLTNLLVAAAAVMFTLFTVGFGIVIALPVLLFFFVTDIVCSIRAAMAASRGEDYVFPFSLELVK
jgi:uncharacterized Tic20 family protein